MRRALLFSAFAVLALLPSSADASTFQAGDLIKGSAPSVYYYNVDEKRYVFPDEKTYFTWYSGFDSVKTVTDAELAAVAIGGNVTYRPGTRMIKVESDPRVYAVAHGSILRWVETEAVARELYGDAWNKMIDDLSAAFFVNYNIGASVSSSTQFNRLTEQALAPTIYANILVAMPTPTPTPTPTSTTPIRGGTLTHVPENISPGQEFTLMAAANPSTAIWYVNIWFEGVHMRLCEYSPCGATLNFPSGKTSVVGVAEFVWGAGVRAFTTSTIEAASGSSGVTVTMRPEIKPNSLHEIIADVDSSFVAKTIDIYIDGNSVRGCNDVQRCRYLGTESSLVGTTHEVYVIAKDANGFTRRSATYTYAVVQNPRPTLTVSVGKTVMLPGETVDVSVQSYDDDGIVYTDITTSDGTFSKRCETNSCTATVTRPTGGSFSFIGTAADPNGAVGTASSSVIVVQ